MRDLDICMGKNKLFKYPAKDYQNDANPEWLVPGTSVNGSKINE
jgi:hypothetical protein